METNKHIDLLGYKAKDKVTGYKGVITTISFDLFGCVQAVITPEVKDGSDEVSSGHWFDVTRLKIIGSKKVMDSPNFEKGYIAEGKKGAAPKPLQR